MMVTAEKMVTGQFKFLLPAIIEVKNGKILNCVIDQDALKKTRRHLVADKAGVSLLVDGLKLRAL